MVFRKSQDVSERTNNSKQSFVGTQMVGGKPSNNQGTANIAAWKLIVLKAERQLTLEVQKALKVMRVINEHLQEIDCKHNIKTIMLEALK